MFSSIEAYKTLTMHVGESSIFDSVRFSPSSSARTAIRPTLGCPERVVCLAIPHGAVLRLSGIPKKLQDGLDLVCDTAMVVFREKDGKDYLRFDNSSRAELDRRFNGIEVELVAQNVEEYFGGLPKADEEDESFEEVVAASRDFIHNCNGGAVCTPSEIILAGFSQAFRSSGRLWIVLGAMLILAN